MRVIFRVICLDFRLMSWRCISLLVVTIAATIPASAFASGSVPTTRSPVRESFNRLNARAERSSATSHTRVLIAEEPYNLGKTIFSGKYKFGNPKLTTANVAEKKQRLVSLQRALPAPERGRLDPAELSKRLSDHEMNALEYYLATRFGKFITKSPSWAKAGPPPKIALAR